MKMEATSTATCAIVYCDQTSSLSIAEALAILEEPNTSKVSLHAITSPQPGNIFLFNRQQKLFSCEDGFQWTHCGRHNIPKPKPVLQKAYYRQKLKREVSSFRKEVYTAFGIGNNFVLVHYLDKKCQSKAADNGKVANESQTASRLSHHCLEIEGNVISNTTTVEGKEIHQTAPATNFSFELPWSVFLTIRPMSDVHCGRLAPTWCKTFHDQFHRVWPQCSLAFTGHHIRKPNSRKRNSPFIRAYARCKVSGCVKVSFRVAEPLPQQDVVVRVEVDKRCVHELNRDEPTESVLNKRQLTGQERTIVTGVAAPACANIYLERLASRSMNEPVTAGNVTACQTPDVLRRAALQERMSSRLSDDPIQELLMESDQFHVLPKQKHIGSRTHKDVKAGKIIRIDDDGFENFSDYWTDPDTPQSPASVHKALHPDERKNQTESLLAQEHESSATLSPFTPSHDEFTNLETNGNSGIFTVSCRQPINARSDIVHNAEPEVVETVTEEHSLTGDSTDKIKTIAGNVRPVETDDVTVTVELPTMATEHKSKTSVSMKEGARARSAEKDVDGSDATTTKGLKSSDVATTSSSCRRRVGVSQEPLAEEAMKDKMQQHCIEKCPDVSTVVVSKAVINPVVVLHALSPHCSVAPGTTSVSFPLNMKGDIAGTLSRPATGLPSADVCQASPDVVKPTRKRLTYSTESPDINNIDQGAQQSDIVHLEINRIAASSSSSTDKRSEAAATVAMSQQSLKVADAANAQPEVSQNRRTIYEEFPVVTRERKSHCHTAKKPKDATGVGSSNCVTNVVASVAVGRRPFLLENAKDSGQSKAVSGEVHEAFHKNNEKQSPAEKEIEADSLQDSGTDTEADNAVMRNDDCFDLFDKAPLSLARPVRDVAIEDDDLAADGNDGTLICLSSRPRVEQERDHSDAGDGGDDDADDDDDFQMVPLSQVKTIKLNCNAGDTKVGSKKVIKAAKPTTSRSSSTGAGFNYNFPDTVIDGSAIISEKPYGTKNRTALVSKGKANKLGKVRKEDFAQNVKNNKPSSETTTKQDEAMSVDVAKDVVKDVAKDVAKTGPKTGPKARKGYKGTRESQQSDVLRKRRKRTQTSNNCYVSEQKEDGALSTEKGNRRFSSRRTAAQPQPVAETEVEEEDEDMLDALIVSKKRRKAVILSECEGSPGEETKERSGEGKTPGHKTNTVKKVVVGTDQKREGLPSSEKTIMKSLTDAFKKNKRAMGKNKRIAQPLIVPERTKKQKKGKHNGHTTALDPIPINERVTGSSYNSQKKDKTVSKEAQTRHSEHLMITCGQMSEEATDRIMVSDPRQSSALDNVSNIEPAKKTHLGRKMDQYISTPKTMKRSSRRAATVAKRKSSLLLHNEKQKKLSPVSLQSAGGKKTERQLVARTEDKTPGNDLTLVEAQNSSELPTDDSAGKRKQRKKSGVLQEESIVTISNGVEKNEMPRINQRNVAKTPQTRLSVASRQHYFDATISTKKAEKQKLRKIYPPEGSNGEGMRRSRRTRVKALDWFRNERIHYERRESGFVVAGIYSPNLESNQEVAEKFVMKMNGKEKPARKKRHAERKRLSIHADLSHSLLSKTQTEIKVVNPQTQEEVFMECVKTVDQAKMVGVSGKPPSDDEPLLLCKPIRQKTFASGTLIIRPLQIKKMQFVQNDTMLFHVIHGKVEVTIHQTNFVVESRDKFFVPVGNSYSIRNLRNEDAELDFTQIKS